MSTNSFAVTGEFFDLPTLKGFEEAELINDNDELYVRAVKKDDVNEWYYYAGKTDYEGIYATAEDLLNKELIEKELDEAMEYDSFLEEYSSSFEQNKVTGYKYVAFNSIYNYDSYKEYEKLARIPTKSNYIYVRATSTVSMEDCEIIFNKVMSTIDIKEYDEELFHGLTVDFAVREDIPEYEPVKRVTKGFIIIPPALVIAVVLTVIFTVRDDRKSRKQQTEDN